MFKFGFELEGFYSPDGVLSVPPKEYPTDSFPGLVEFRTFGACDLLAAYAEILILTFRHPDVDFNTSSTTFTAEQRGVLRRRHEVKDCVDIRNLYGKSPRLLGNKTIASLQVNISNQISKEYWDKDRVHHPPVYGLFDIPQIVRNFDEEFASEIKEAGRQPGEYAVKDAVRLEYRSLPNTVFEKAMGEGTKKFIERIESCIL